MKMRVVGDKLSLQLYQLAGISGESPEEADEIVAAIDRFTAEPEVGVVLVTSSRVSKIGDRFNSYLERKKLPVVLQIPDFYDKQGGTDKIRKYLQKTLGIRM